MINSLKSSFLPVVDKNTRILVLGSLPGEESLRQGQYYANPRNSFWKIIFRIFGQSIPDSYHEKLSFLKSKGIGLWDVILTAERDGSLDSKIRNEIPNEFSTLLKQYIDIRVLIFNGRKAEKAFKRLIVGKQDLPDRLLFKYFPSTSPANSKISFEAKASYWNELMDFLE